MRVLGWLMYYYLRLVWFTARVQVSGNTDLRAQALQGRARFVYALWHGRLTGVTYDALQGATITGIASRSGDGEFATRFLELFGFRLIRGSSANPNKPTKQKGGAAALAAALRFLRQTDNGILALTPDGPKGPRGVCQHGVAAIAVRTGAPVVPVAWSSKHALTFNSWDRALIPLPFSRIHLIWGQALTPPAATADRTVIEEFRGEVERALLDVTLAADRNAGRAEPFCQGGAK
ncbi:lysophospholipid acyltransferase family protein [Pontivivens nitratireducens]|uniref:Lysophospholipid acyltransferase family protein n=1 Tax=Pontivivens nitratireducens TaxID=2758038 RepID=A0A6G7VH00_9RHOB|nr:lysophospholipid acyltransferase family protein [Pontibrevibacter nitratireducens]QIK39363.1 lysophospholipid acyltransferase family protein [Pontibrevibacter nitratireducens]